MDRIPDSVRRFLLTSIPSVPHLEALMLLWREHRAFPVDEIASRLYVSIAVAEALVEELTQAELLSSEDDGAHYRVRTDPPELQALLSDLDQTYARQVRAVAELIHSNLDRKAHRFAKAFYWRKR
jgi:predicted transcriptional regulator